LSSCGSNGSAMQQVGAGCVVKIGVRIES